MNTEKKGMIFFFKVDEDIDEGDSLAWDGL